MDNLFLAFNPFVFLVFCVPRQEICVMHHRSDHSKAVKVGGILPFLKSHLNDGDQSLHPLLRGKLIFEFAQVVCDQILLFIWGLLLDFLNWALGDLHDGEPWWYHKLVEWLVKGLIEALEPKLVGANDLLNFVKDWPGVDQNLLFHHLFCDLTQNVNVLTVFNENADNLNEFIWIIYAVIKNLSEDMQVLKRLAEDLQGVPWDDFLVLHFRIVFYYFYSIRW